MEKEKIKVVCTVSCRNSPKKMLLLDLFKAFAKSEFEFISDHITDDVHWRIVGKSFIERKNEVLDQLNIARKGDITHIELFNIITHGNVAAVNGVIKKKSGDQTEFCHVYTFKSAGKHIIKEMRSYVVEGGSE